MNVHVALAPLPDGVEAVVERSGGDDLYLVVQQGLSQIATAAAVADILTTPTDP